MGRSSVKTKERNAAIKRRLKKQREQAASTTTSAPILQTTKKRNKRAEAILRRLKKQTGSLTKSAGGIESGTYSVKMPGREGSQIHDLDFYRKDARRPFEPRENLSKSSREVRNANITYQQGSILDEIKVGDGITATPLGSERNNKQNARARIYDRATKGALKAEVDSAGFGQIKSLKTGDKEFINIKKEVVNFDPNDLKKSLTKLAAGKIAARLMGPKAQAAMLLDDASEALTGKRLTKRALEHYRDKVEPEIKKRLKKGQRVTPVSPLSYR